MDAQPADDLLGRRLVHHRGAGPDARVDPSTLRRWRTARPRQGPPFICLSSRVTLYSAHDVRRWLATRRIDPGQAA